MKVIFFGTPVFVLPVIQALKENFDLVAVVTSPNPNPVKDYAQKNSIPVFDPDKLDEQFVDDLKKLEPDLIVVAAYGKIIPQSVLDIPKIGNLNVHPSALPKYRGASPIQSTILDGKVQTEVSIMVMDEKMDHGPIITTSVLSILPEDNTLTLSNKLFTEAAEILVDRIPDAEAEIKDAKPQDHTQATFCKLIKKEDGYFDIENPPTPEKLDRMIRAYYPWPTAWTKWKGKIVKLLPNKMMQMEGKKPTKLADFLRGYPDFPLKSENL